MRAEKTENLQDKETKMFLEENLGETFDEDMQIPTKHNNKNPQWCHLQPS